MRYFLFSFFKRRRTVEYWRIYLIMLRFYYLLFRFRFLRDRILNRQVKVNVEYRDASNEYVTVLDADVNVSQEYTNKLPCVLWWFTYLNVLLGEVNSWCPFFLDFAYVTPSGVASRTLARRCLSRVWSLSSHAPVRTCNLSWVCTPLLRRLVVQNLIPIDERMREIYAHNKHVYVV